MSLRQENKQMKDVVLKISSRATWPAVWQLVLIVAC